jgi:hypothetical protein
VENELAGLGEADCSQVVDDPPKEPRLIQDRPQMPILVG